MDAAGGDPLRAQEFEQKLNGIWFYRLVTWREMQTERDKQEEEKLKKERREARMKRGR